MPLIDKQGSLDPSELRSSFAERIAAAAVAQVGRPFLEFEEAATAFSRAPEGFDCVGLIEFCIALARAGASPQSYKRKRVEEEFATLQALVERGFTPVRQAQRPPMSSWFEALIGAGYLCDVTGTILRACSKLKRPARDAMLPVGKFNAASSLLRPGDIVAFIGDSGKGPIEGVHGGIVVARGSQLQFVHADKAAGAVIEDPSIQRACRRYPETRGAWIARPLGA
jgi:hypothetical protein